MNYAFNWLGIALCFWAVAWCTAHVDDNRHPRIEHPAALENK